MKNRLGCRTAKLLGGVAICLFSIPTLGGDEVTLEQIMAHPDWLGRQPQDPYWADDSASILYWRKRPGSEGRDLFEVSIRGGASRQIDFAEQASRDSPPGMLNNTRDHKAYIRNGDLFLKNLRTGGVRQLTRTDVTEAGPQILNGDPVRVAFRRDDVIYVRELVSGLEYQPAIVRYTEQPDSEEPDHLALQQARLLEVVRDKRAEREAALVREDAARAGDPTRSPKPIYLGKKWQYKASGLSPDGRRLLLVLRPVDDDRADEGRNTNRLDKYADFVTETGYVEIPEARPLVGTRPPTSDRLVLVNLESQTLIEVGFENLPGIIEDPLAVLKTAQGIEVDPEWERAVTMGKGSFAQPDLGGWAWSDDGSRLLVQLFASDHKDRWLALVNPESGDLQTILHERDPAWISTKFNEFGWLHNQQVLYYVSEASGYAQIYLSDLAQTRQLTTGDAEHFDVRPGPGERYLYYRSNADHPGVYEVYRYDLKKEKIERLTDLGGMNGYAVSPDGRHLLVIHSETTTPPELFVQRAKPGAPARPLTDTLSDAFKAIAWVEPMVVAVPSSHHSRVIYSRVYLPQVVSASDPGRAPAADGDSSVIARRPAIMFVHGAGYLQNSHLGWSGYFREFMFHTLLTRRGYVVMDMDYRASMGYGRDWRTAIYRRMGQPELEDLIDVVLAWAFMADLMVVS